MQTLEEAWRHLHVCQWYNCTNISSVPKWFMCVLAIRAELPGKFDRMKMMQVHETMGFHQSCPKWWELLFCRLRLMKAHRVGVGLGARPIRIYPDERCHAGQSRSWTWVSELQCSIGNAEFATAVSAATAQYEIWNFIMCISSWKPFTPNHFTPNYLTPNYFTPILQCLRFWEIPFVPLCCDFLRFELICD